MHASFRELLNPLDRTIYMAWRAVGTPCPLALRMKDGSEIVLREFKKNDYATAYEIFVNECYRPRAPRVAGAPKTVVDLGANVGYATVYLARVFPEAHIYAFEPHPVHFECLTGHIQKNGLQGRVTAYRAAAGAGPKTCWLTDAGRQSMIVGDSRRDSELRVDVVDLFSSVGHLAPLDFLKMDIEGGEYEILLDDRFPSLGVRELAMEWHSTPDYPNGRERCLNRLKALNYDCEIREDFGGYGTLSATLRASATLRGSAGLLV